MGFLEKAQKVIDSYKNMPRTKEIEVSLVEEMAHLIAAYMHIYGVDIYKFNFDKFFKRLKFPPP